MQYRELEKYFIIRFEELLNKRTPDSYRVRNHNALSILEELCELLDGWQKRKIQTHETVVLCAEECKKLISEDAWIDYSFYDKNLFVRDIEEYIKILPDSKDKRENVYEISSKLKYVCRKCIDINSGIYANNLFAYLVKKINEAGDLDENGSYIKEMQLFEKALSSLCNELLRLGHSKNHLYLKASQLQKGSLKIGELKEQLLSQTKSTYEVVYKFQGNKYIDSCKSEYGFSDNIESIIVKLNPQVGQHLKSFFSTDGRKLFRIFKVEALDTYAAIKIAKAQMGLLLDTLYLGNNARIAKFEPQVLVVSASPNGGYYTELRNQNYQLDGTYYIEPEMSIRLKLRVDEIIKSKFVKDDAKERLKSALRHLRMANYSNDIELQFINYWIALEFIFSSPISHENTFGRIKKHLVNVMCVSYISRNVSYLDKLLHEDGALDEKTSLNHLTENEWGELIDKVNDKRTQYRLCKMKSHLHNKEAIENYITTHRTNIEWHIARIYRMRNELIHEAALKQDIEGATSNLRFYLVFLLNQMVNYFYSARMSVSINDFFHDYENKSDIILTTKDRDVVINAAYELSLIC